MNGVVRALDTLRLDLTYALRLWRRAPAFTACVVGTLAVGMGATVAMFSVVTACCFDRWSTPRRRKCRGGRGAPAWKNPVGVRLSAAVGASFFDVLGVAPALGRGWSIR